MTASDVSTMGRSPVDYYLSPILRFVGRDRADNARTGALTRDPAEFVAECYAKGWRSLAVSATTASGSVLVGEIARHGDRPRLRTWWAEGAPS